MPWGAETFRAGRKPLSSEVPPLRLAFVLGCDNPSILITVMCGSGRRHMVRHQGQSRPRPDAKSPLNRR